MCAAPSNELLWPGGTQVLLHSCLYEFRILQRVVDLEKQAQRKLQINVKQQLCGKCFKK